MTASATTTTVRLVPIGDLDLEPVAALVNRAFGRYSDIFKGQRTSTIDYRDECGEEARVILVEDGGVLVATGMVAKAERFVESDQLGPAGTERPGITTVLDEAHPWAGALYLGLVGVEPAIMNRGLGRIVVQTFEDLARAEGYPRAVLGTLREFGLVDYYEKLDYRVIHEDVYPAGHWELVVEHHHCEMVKDL
jgi:GNAT superfamily N-acetyltransferase